MRPLEPFAPDFEMAHSVEARRAARFARDFAPSVSDATWDQFAAFARAATVGMSGIGSPTEPVIPATIAAQARFALAEGDRVDVLMATLPRADHD